jgi:dTDP-4-dehydrorhamnose reductase
MFSDVFFTPILVNDLVDIMFRLLEAGGAGIYNVVGDERVSKEAFGRLVAEVFGYSQNRIRSISVDQAGLKARRPKDMSLSCEKVVAFLGRRMPGVVEGVGRMKTLHEQGWHRAMEMAAVCGAEPGAFGRTPIGPFPR